MKRNVVILFAVAFLFRLIALNQSLWLDEATTAKAAQLSFSQLLTQFSPTDFHPPLYYLFMKLWVSVFGISEIALRLPSVIFSLITGWFVYKIGQLLAKQDKEDISRQARNIGLWSAAFFLFNPLIIYYSQEARMYALVTLFLTMSLYYFLKTNSEKLKTKKSIVLFNIVTGLSFLTFYASVYFIAAFYLYLIWKKQFKLLFKLLPGSVISLLIISPLLYQQLVNSQQALTEVKNWSLVLGKVTLKNFALIPLKFATGRVTLNPKIMYYVVGGLWTVIVFFNVAKGSLKNRQLLFFLLAPLGLGLIASFFTPMFQYFRFIYLIPVMSLLIALGPKRTVIRAVLVVGFILFSLQYLLITSNHRENWKEMFKAVGEYKGRLYMIESASDPLRYYNKQVKVVDLKGLKSEPPKENHIIVLPYVADVHGVDYQKSLQSYGYQKAVTQNLRGIVFEGWEKVKP